MTALFSTSKLCSTCAFWAGTRKVKPDGQVEIHPYFKGYCQGGGFSYALMVALATCSAMAIVAGRGRAGFGSENGY